MPLRFSQDRAIFGFQILRTWFARGGIMCMCSVYTQDSGSIKTVTNLKDVGIGEGT